MANWSDPRSSATPFRVGAAATRSDAYDAGLRSYMLSVYNYMTSGVLLTGIVALAFAFSGAVATLFDPVTGKPNALGWIVTIAPLGIVFAMSFGQQRMQTGTLKALFWAFAVLMGLSLSTVFLAYTGTSVAGAFFAAAAGFAGLSLVGYTTKRDLSAFGAFLTVGLIGLLVASVIAIFVPALNLMVSIVGVLIFAGLTAYDTQRTKAMYEYVAGTDQVDRVVVMAALSLYLDFINMFLFILRLFGAQRS
ncbi:Bax inhibitor-1 family protein [uncultured Sphingomonas sp.]|uniref:Bax inhibitor-1/YccA family protein n=1 Tax=uncultured Sphingomonas sp. TaxID=158754 RepID=UPI0035C97B9A